MYLVVTGQFFYFFAKNAKHTGAKNATIFDINILNENGMK